jgi:predicted AAA+ superfamily ATPase
LQRSIAIGDIVTQYKITNISLLERLILFVYNNIGNIFSLRKISSFLSSNNKENVNIEKIGEYLTYLENIYIIKKVQRYDIKGKKVLETNCKYYLADHSLQYSLSNFQKTNLPGILENIVFNELIRRGYKVYIGKLNERDNREIDFVAEKQNSQERIYIQVCKEFNSAKTIDREFNVLADIKDSFPKYVVTLDELYQETKGGIKSIHLKDFLLSDEF